MARFLDDSVEVKSKGKKNLSDAILAAAFSKCDDMKQKQTNSETCPCDIFSCSSSEFSLCLFKQRIAHRHVEYLNGFLWRLLVFCLSQLFTSIS